MSMKNIFVRKYCGEKLYLTPLGLVTCRVFIIQLRSSRETVKRLLPEVRLFAFPVWSFPILRVLPHHFAAK